MAKLQMRKSGERPRRPETLFFFPNTSKTMGITLWAREKYSTTSHLKVFLRRRRGEKKVLGQSRKKTLNGTKMEQVPIGEHFLKTIVKCRIIELRNGPLKNWGKIMKNHFFWQQALYDLMFLGMCRRGGLIYTLSMACKRLLTKRMTFMIYRLFRNKCMKCR